ncbi:HK97 gp10 family phage protein [Microbacterium sp. gxy059]|uniref:HK97 gp10 family phage protein n=1 Tax=Microbacterium sp. gxy059 TaxID=2957199 RepID=UPI003D9513BB
MSTFRWNGDDAASAVAGAATTGLNKAARALLAEAQSRVPVDTGDLRNSGATHDATPDDLEAAVTFNAQQKGFNYALAVHEGVDMNFQKTYNPNAQSKYLEGPAIELESQLIGVVRMEIKRALGG